jgi:hypothetical protein
VSGGARAAKSKFDLHHISFPDRNDKKDDSPQRREERKEKFLIQKLSLPSLRPLRLCGAN